MATVAETSAVSGAETATTESRPRLVQRFGPPVAGAMLLGGGGFAFLALAGIVAWSWNLVSTEDGMGVFVMGLFNLVLACFAIAGGLLSLRRVRWKFALLGGVLGIFAAPHLAIPAVAVLFFSEEGFDN